LWLQVRAGGYVRVCVCVCGGGVRRVALRCKTVLLGYRMCVGVCVCVCVAVCGCVCVCVLVSQLGILAYIKHQHQPVMKPCALLPLPLPVFHIALALSASYVAYALALAYCRKPGARRSPQDDR
jgi:hypothetical protein